MSEEILLRIEKKIDVLISLLASQIITSETNTVAAPKLNQLGMSAAEIATVLNSTPGAVRKYISDAKNK